MKNSVFGILVFVFAAGSLAAGEEDRREDDEAIRKNLSDYVAAYQRKDAAALASMWSESGRFLDPQTGNAITGRKGIERLLGKRFEGSGEIALEAKIVSLRFLTDDVAIEEGEAHVVFPGSPPTVGNYQAIHVKKGDKWLIDSIRETAAEEISTDDAAEPVDETEGVPELEDLAWMIGEWDDIGGGATIQHSCQWGMWKSFIRRDFAVVIEDRVEIEGIEIIGWDPSEKQIRSWVFDSGGGFGSAIWEKGEGEWLKKMSGTTRDGKKVFAVHAMKRIDENSYEFRAHGRESDGVLLPNLNPIKVVRLVEEN